MLVNITVGRHISFSITHVLTLLMASTVYITRVTAPWDTLEIAVRLVCCHVGKVSMNFQCDYTEFENGVTVLTEIR